jgi:hypothetical protein
MELVKHALARLCGYRTSASWAMAKKAASGRSLRNREVLPRTPARGETLALEALWGLCGLLWGSIEGPQGNFGWDSLALDAACSI